MKLSKDVEIDEQVDFNTLLQNEQLLQGLSLSGYERPSPIQLKAIPIGRLGIDLIAQAKSGTGKTVVFGVIAIENVNISIQLPQVIMVAPTREIAVQIRDVVRSLAQLMPLKCEAIIGGLSVQADAQKLAGCQIIVGTPGRLLALLEDKKINTSQLKLWVMDEADKLMSDKLQSQVQAVFNKLPKTIQCIAFSATFTEELVADLSMFMKSPQQIRLTEGVPTLKEVQQYYVNIQEASSNLAVYRLKFEEAAKLLSKIPFYQCMIFVNNLPRSIELTDWLNEIGWKSGHISSSLTQDKRLSVMEQMRQFKLRVLVCSDLVARGIDIDRVNLVINLDMPWEVETYLHRVGRTGRYGTSGIAVNLIGPEDVTFLKVLEERKIQIRPLPDKVSYSEYIKELSAEEQDSLKKYQSVNIEAKPFKHVEKIRKKQQPLKKKIKKISEMEATEINVRIKKAQPKPIFIPPDLFF